MTICQLPCGSRPSDLLTVALLPGTRRHTPCMSPAHHFVLYKFPLPSPDRSSLIFLLLPPPLWVANPSLIIVRSVPRTISFSCGKVSPRLLGSRGDSFIPIPSFLPSFLSSFLPFFLPSHMHSSLLIPVESRLYPLKFIAHSSSSFETLYSLQRIRSRSKLGAYFPFCCANPLSPPPCDICENALR